MTNRTNRLTPRCGIPAVLLYALVAFLATTTFAVATTAASGVPWEGALTGILTILSGQTARLLAALMFIGGALLWGFSRNEDGMQTIGKVILAVGLIIGAASISDTLFGAVI